MKCLFMNNRILFTVKYKSNNIKMILGKTLWVFLWELES